jgi:hypothetical protein
VLVATAAVAVLASDNELLVAFAACCLEFAACSPAAVVVSAAASVAAAATPVVATAAMPVATRVRLLTLDADATKPR